MASHLAARFPEVIDFLFVDRSLGNLTSLSESRVLGEYTRSLYKTFSRNWEI